MVAEDIQANAKDTADRYVFMHGNFSSATEHVLQGRAGDLKIFRKLGLRDFFGYHVGRR